MNKSESIAQLSAALVKFQGKMIRVVKEAENPYFKNKYASLSQIIEAVQGPLSECGLAVIQLPASGNQLETILLHESGEYISESYEMKPVKQDPQQLGSAITYQRRYALGAILCLNIDEDDDGNKASEPAQTRKDMPAVSQAEKKAISEKAFGQLLERIKTNTDPVARGNLIAMARRTYLPLTDEQEMRIADIIDNVIAVEVEEVR